MYNESRGEIPNNLKDLNIGNQVNEEEVDELFKGIAVTPEEEAEALRAEKKRNKKRAPELISDAVKWTIDKMRGKNAA